jgi:hypothetical protein
MPQMHHNRVYESYLGDLEAVAAWARVMENFGFGVPDKVFNLYLVICKGISYSIHCWRSSAQ